MEFIDLETPHNDTLDHPQRSTPVDAENFDALARSLSASGSRRALVLAVGTALAPLLTREDAAAHDVLKKCKKIKDKAKKKKCVKKAKAHSATHTTEALPGVTQSSPPPPPPPPSPPPPASVDCPSGTTACDGSCVNLLTNPNHCRGCNQPCAVQAPGTCGATGQCVGGTCVRYGYETICRQPVCVTPFRSQYESHCDGTGSCVSLGLQTCTPGRCDSATGRCTSSCSLDSDCHGDSGWCDGGLCRDKDDGGHPCTRPEQCRSGSCYSGVCCYTPCTVANATGTCPGGTCVLVCHAGWGNCDNTTPNGCEVDFRSHPSHCGGCNQPCSGPCGPNDSGARECVEGSCFCTF